MAIKLFVICSGLGRIARGFESFAAETAAALSADPMISVRCFGAKGAATFLATEVPSLHRDGWMARCLGAAFRRDGYFAEQATFVTGLLPHLIRGQPDVLLCSDRTTLDLLWYLRATFGFRYRLLGSNGGPMGPPFSRVDFVQHVLPETYHKCDENSAWFGRQVMVPYAFNIGLVTGSFDAAEIAKLRSGLDLPVDASIILVGGAVNMSQKRADYVVREVAAAARRVPSRRLFLLMLGQQDGETPQVRALAADLLGCDGFDIRTVKRDVMSDYYTAVDLFTLGSLSEGFGRVWVEACAAGLPCLAHDYSTTRFILGNTGYFGDFATPGALANLIQTAVTSPPSDAKIQQAQIQKRFSWNTLLPEYATMVQRCSEMPPLLTAFEANDWPR